MNTVKGARASVGLYSVVSTAMENGLNPQASLTYLLEQLSDVMTSQIDSMLPWSESLPETVFAPRSAEKRDT